MLQTVETRPDIDITQFRDLSTKLNHRASRVYRTVFGENGWGYFKAVGRGQLRETSFDLDSINNEVVARFGIYSGLPDNLSQNLYWDHWNKQRATARSTWETIIETIAPHRDEALQLLANIGETPDEVIKNIARPTFKDNDSVPLEGKGSSAKLKHQEAALLVLAATHGDIDTTQTHDTNRRKSRRITDYLEENLFIGANHGDTESMILYSDHELDTNTLLRHDRELGELEVGARRFVHYVQYRETPFGPVLYEQSPKPPEAAALKALRAVIEDGNTIQQGKKLSAEITDLTRFRFTLLPPYSVGPRVFLFEIIQILKGFEGGMTESDRDKKFGKHTGSSGNVRFERYKGLMPYFDDLSVEIETGDYGNYIHQYRHIGRRDPETGLWLGDGHRLYNIRRTIGPAMVAMPPPLYGVSIIEEAAKTSDRVALELKTEGLHAEKVA